ncbi:hypothetical protein JB92DRAFT_3149395 [Gautieria morchelliformis]|nr:hypothetical protein JB92DRAFT_3149395 [Gautieria morchelliformis]
MASSAPTSLLPPPPPDGLNYIASLRPCVTLLMIGTVFSTVLVCMLIAMLLFSNPATHHELSFILNVVSLLLGICLGFMNGYLEIHTMLSPLVPIVRATFMADSVINALGPILVEFILFTRLLVIIPYRMTPHAEFFGVMSFPVLVKIARIVNVSVYFKKLDTAARGPTPVQSGTALFATVPNIKVEWILQLLDNMYTSGLFLTRLRRHQRTISNASLDRHSSIAKKFQSLFLISLSNFVFPVLLSLVQLILYFGKVDPITVVYVQQINYFVSTIGVVFATVWARGNHWAKNNLQSTMPMHELSTGPDSSFNHGRRTNGTNGCDTCVTHTISGTKASDGYSKRFGASSKEDHVVVPLQVLVEHSAKEMSTG